ncbi:hypothetical protein Pla52n_23570 [Stieleria varia]|uniref:Uncharacterized protein n=1 Tax=Stieleria varia TaxID=2528005 RepID=A0A5C6AXY5_9BACT|nr:hypothetical protein Pla52n_23570 [Stieleria varia]
MAKLGQKESYPNSVELLLWNQAWSDDDLVNFFEYVFTKFPLVTEAGRKLGVSGKGWGRFLATEKFPVALKRRGPSTLRCVIFRELEPLLDMRLDRDALECGRINIAGKGFAGVRLCIGFLVVVCPQSMLPVVATAATRHVVARRGGTRLGTGHSVAVSGRVLRPLWRLRSTV